MKNQTHIQILNKQVYSIYIIWLYVKTDISDGERLQNATWDDHETKKPLETEGM